MNDFLSAWSTVIASMNQAFASVLPAGPSLPDMSQYVADSMVGTGLAWFNWFVPVGVVLGIVSAWLAALLLVNVLHLALSNARRVTDWRR